MPPTPKTATGAPAADNVVDLDGARAEGRNAALSYVREVRDLCALAGKPAMADAFIEKEAAPADVRKELLDARASADAARDVSTQTLAGAGATAKAPWGDAVASANRRNGTRAGSAR